MSNKGYKKISGLKKYNKILSILVKQKKKSGEVYSFKDVQKEASRIYRADFKNVALSKIRVKDVKESSKKDSELVLKASDVPNYWFNDQSYFNYWYQVGEWANRFANAFPMIPIMLITKSTERNPLVVQGATGNYEGSIFQRWTEDRRDEINNSGGDDTNSGDWTIGNFGGVSAIIGGKEYAVWLEEGLKPPKIAPKPIIIEPRKTILIDKLEKEEKERREKEKPKKKRGRPKKTEEEKKKPLPKVKKKPIDKKPTPNRVSEIRALIDGLRADIETIKQEVKDGFNTKKEAQKQISKIREDISNLTRKLEKGGVI